ncbi:MAG: hypothetical protein K2G89_03425 [Lachnospiraceae bacterium]|nr:hypothetical protein [Lachnospiraceae bacterium]
MGKVTLGQWTQKDEQFTRILKAELGKKGKDYKNLMRRTGRSQSNIHRKYREPDRITVGDLRGFIQEAGLSREDVCDFLFND